jgi:16S rRNA (uracil1498-N3)-methyltransferase
MELFYFPVISGSELILNEEESKHCIRVLRLRKDDKIYLTDGKGQLSLALLENTDPRATRVRIVETTSGYRKRDHLLHIAIAPTKNPERFEWFLEKATEIGIDEITPVICRRSERMTINTKRALRILISGIKQSQRTYLPVLNDVTTLKDILARENPGSKIITHCNYRDLPIINERFTGGSPAIVLVGPEGDFTAEEIGAAKDRGFSEASLGPFIYRTETAGIMACYAFNLFFRQ